MFDKINVAQIYCFLAEVDWVDLVEYAHIFMGKPVDEEAYGEHSVLLANEKMIFRGERFMVGPDHLPWELEASLTLRRREKPYDGWINVQFARELAQALDGVAYCEVPEEVSADHTGKYMLRFDADEQGLYSSLVELADFDADFVEIEAAYEIDLRNLELFQTVFPYR